MAERCPAERKQDHIQLAIIASSGKYPINQIMYRVN